LRPHRGAGQDRSRAPRGPEGHTGGLGLAQVYGFARQSGGAARIASAPGAGTTVTLLLPRSAVEPQVPPPAPSEASRFEDGNQKQLRMLLVEDDDDVAALTAEMLRHLGHDVSRADSGAAALKALISGMAVDVVLTDVILPGGQDGVDVALRPRAERPSMPVLLYSGYGGAPARVTAAGCTCCGSRSRWTS